MSIYGSQLFYLYDKDSVSCIICLMEKAIKKIRKIPNTSHCCLLPYINDCNYIDSILERWCIQFLYNIFNSENQLYTSMRMDNCDYTINGVNPGGMGDKMSFNPPPPPCFEPYICCFFCSGKLIMFYNVCF